MKPSYLAIKWICLYGYKIDRSQTCIFKWDMRYTERYWCKKAFAVCIATNTYIRWHSIPVFVLCKYLCSSKNRKDWEVTYNLFMYFVKLICGFHGSFKTELISRKWNTKEEITSTCIHPATSWVPRKFVFSFSIFLIWLGILHVLPPFFVCP